MEKTNATTAAASKMDAAAIATTAAAILKKLGTIAAIKATSAASREKYGAANWAAIFAKCKEFRASDINAAAKGAIDAVFEYRNILAATYRTLSANRDYKALCRYAAATYKGTDAATAAALVRDYFPNVDAESGLPLVSRDYIDEKTAYIYSGYAAADLTASKALAVLKSALMGMKAAAQKARRKATDTTTATADNKRSAGVIVAVYTGTIGKADAIRRGICLAGLKADAAAADTATRRNMDAAAKLLGRPIPAHCQPLAEVNALCRKAYTAAASKALAEKMDAIKADAAAAGVKTADKAK